MTDPNWLPSRVRRNFRIDVFSAVCAGTFVSVLVAFMPVVVRRMGGTPTDVAIIVGSPFVGHLLAPFFTYLLAHIAPVKVVAGTSTLARAIFLAGVLVATTPLMLALTTVAFWVITISNVAAYTALMRGIYPDGERAHVMGKVRVGASVAGIAAAALAGLYIDLVPAQWVFAAAALISLPGAIAFSRIEHSSTGGFGMRRPAAHIARDVWRDRRYRRLMLSFMVFGWGNLMNFAVFPIMLVDHFNAPNTFIGIFSAVQSATMIFAYVIVGRLIDRGSSLRQTFIGTLLVLLVPIGYLVAPIYWALLPVAIVAGVAQASGELTYHTNVVQMSPPGRIAEYAAAQSLLLGLRGSLAPFAASALLGFVSVQAVLIAGLSFMALGAVLMVGAVREPVPAIAPVAVPAT
ncbi:MAG TPA: MFS transporter [Candidatus Limnocylindrales bacterium]|nr:MFS transporter [Candidatus Limnocylindrales bacterium]